MVPPGAPHTFANPGDEALMLLNTFTPDLYVQYFRDLKQMISDGRPAQRDVVLPTRLVRRESCGCPPDRTPAAWRTTGPVTDGRLRP